MPLISFADRDIDRDIDKNPFTVAEFIEILKEHKPDDELRFSGMCGELFFHRFKRRGENLMTVEYDDPVYMEMHTKPVG